MVILFARHGRTNYNDLELCNADPSVDVHLTPQGIQQAHILAGELKSVPIDHIFISQLRRTHQTAEIVNAFHHAAIEVDSLLNDHRSGYESQPTKLLMNALDATENRWTARFNDGESIEDLKQRMTKFLDSLKSQPYDTVLIVTSQWVIQAAVVLIKNIPNEAAWKLEVQQGSCMEFVI